MNGQVITATGIMIADVGIDARMQNKKTIREIQKDKWNERQYLQVNNADMNGFS